MGIQFQTAVEHGSDVLIVRQILYGLQLRKGQCIEGDPNFLVGRKQFWRVAGNAEMESVLFESGYDVRTQKAVCWERLAAGNGLGGDDRDSRGNGKLGSVHGPLGPRLKTGQRVVDMTLYPVVSNSLPHDT